MRNLPQVSQVLVALTALSITNIALADEEHEHEGHSDIEVVVEDGQLVIENGEALSGGGKLFESEFGEQINPNLSSEPGFEVDDGMFLADEILGFQTVGTLLSWDGAAWGAAAATDYLDVIDGEFSVFTYSATSATAGTGIIESADSEGGIHHHVDFEIDTAATSGAYLIEMVLLGLDSAGETTVYDTSESLYVAFNFNMEEEAFEFAVESFNPAPVPVPAALPLLLSGLFGVFAVARRKKN